MTPCMPGLLERLERLAAALESLGGKAGGGVPLPEGAAALVWTREGFRRVRRPSVTNPRVLAGIDRQKAAFYGNAALFAAGRPSHDVLLWGERGTGKSALVRSLPAALPDAPLGLAEVPEERIPDLPRILDTLAADARRWVLVLDDLSFGAPDGRCRELKVLLEGGLEARPENTLLVATSNRRHLVPEHFPAADEIHPGEGVAEAVSLSDRFGLSLGFYPFDEPTYLEAVSLHLAALGAAAPPGWREEALRWAMAKGIRSGRSAMQAARTIAASL